MAEAELDPQGVTRQLILRVTEGAAVEFGGGIAPLEAALDRYGAVFRTSSVSNLPLPCLLLDEPEPLPVDVSPFLPLAERGFIEESYQFEEGLTRANEFVASLAERSRVGYENFGGRAVADFLAAKTLRFVRALIAGGGRPGGGDSIDWLEVRVHTRRSGLVVHKSPSCLLDVVTFFSAPTTPAVGPISPGQWRFLLFERESAPILDPGIFDIPPNFDPYLTAG